ncbi:MAG TPA: hypothetical protein PLR20_14825 [Syntrophales bacterium]|nr:hypothetical protein [Syntrophales bacterium]
MPGVKFRIDVKEAEVALANMRKDLKNLGLETKLTEKEIKQFESRMMKGMGTRQARDSVESLTRSIGLSRKEVEALRRKMDFDPMKKQAHEVNGVLAAMRKHWIGITTAIIGTYMAFDKVFGSSMRYLGQIESYQLGIATSFLLNGQYIDQTTGKVLEGSAGLKAAQQASAGMMAQLQAANLQTIATLDQLVNAYMVTLPVAMSKGFNPDMAKEFTVAMVQAAGAIGLSLDQLAEETRSLLMGTINPRTSRIGVVLGLRNEDIREHSQNADTLFNFLMEKLAAYKTAGIETQRTWAGLWSNMKDIALQAGGMVAEPLFLYIKQWMIELTEDMISLNEETGKIEWNPEFIEGMRNIKAGIYEIIADFHRLAMLIDKVGGSLTALGYILSFGQSDTMKKWNEMFEKRYLENERMLQKLAMMEQGFRVARPEEIKAGQYKEVTDKTGAVRRMPTGLEKVTTPGGQEMFFMKQAKQDLKYVQDTRKKEEEEVKKLNEKLVEETEKLTLTKEKFIEREKQKYLAAGADKVKVEAWAAAQIKKIREEQAEKAEQEAQKLRENLMRRAEEIKKNEMEILKAEEDRIVKEMEIQDRYETRVMEAMKELGRANEMDALERFQESEKKMLELQLKNVQTMLQKTVPAYEAEGDALDKESIALWNQYTALQKRLELMGLLLPLEKELVNQRMKEQAYGEVGMYAGGQYEQFWQEQLDRKIQQMRDAGVEEEHIELWKNEQVKQHVIELNKFRISQTDSVTEAIRLQNEIMQAESKTFCEEVAGMWEEMAGGMQNTMSDFFFDFMVGEMKDFEDYWKQFARGLARSLSDALSRKVTDSLLDFSVSGLSGLASMGMSLLGGGGGGLPLDEFDSPFAHRGRGPYESTGMSKRVPSWIFAGAPRFHDGVILKPDEMAAIIRRDESVLTPGQMKAIAGAGGGTTINVPVNLGGVGGAKQAQELRQEIEATVQRVVKRWS